MASNPYNQYKQQSVMTASPGDLTLMLYDGCIKQAKLAKIYIGEGNIQEKNACLQKAQAIIQELINTLDMSYELSENLFYLYDFILSQLLEANIKNDVNCIDAAVELLTELRNVWAEAIKADRRMAYNE